MSVHSAARDTARALARKNRSQVRVPAKKPDHWIQAVVQSVDSAKGTASVLRPGSSVPFDAKVGGHYTFGGPTAGTTVWLVMINGTSPMIMTS